LAFGMNARGSSELIIASIGLSLGVLSQDLFSMIVAMAIATTMAMPPTLRWALKRVPMREEEVARLEREALAERSFVGNFERLLLAADDSPNGQFASRIGGLLAGALEAPVTVLPVDQLDQPVSRHGVHQPQHAGCQEGDAEHDGGHHERNVWPEKKQQAEGEHGGRDRQCDPPGAAAGQRARQRACSHASIRRRHRRLLARSLSKRAIVPGQSPIISTGDG